MAWYNNWGDFTGDVKHIISGQNPSNNPPPRAIPAGGPQSGVPLPMAPVPTGQTGFGSTQPVLPNIPGVPGTDSSGGDSGGGIDWGSFISKVPGWVLDGLKIGLPAAIDWMKKNSGTLIAGANVAEAAYRQMQADKYAGKAFDLASGAYNEKAPLRTAGIAGMLNPGANTPDLSALRMIAGAGSGNPFAKALPMAGPQAVGNHGPGSPVPMPMGGSTVPQNVNNVPSRLVGVPQLPGSNGTPATPPVIPSRLVGVPQLPGSGR